VSLGRLVLAWAPVAAWFVIATWAIPLLVAALAKRPDQPGIAIAVERSLLKWRLAEAALLTLLASLWFDSLGSGGWWLLFLLVGALAVVPTWLGAWRRAEMPRGTSLVGVCADLARYVVAGAILAWRLG